MMMLALISCKHAEALRYLIEHINAAVKDCGIFQSEAVKRKCYRLLKEIELR